MSEQNNQMTMKRPPRRGPGHGPGPGGGMMPAEKAKDFKGTMNKLIRYMSKYHAAIIIVMIFTVASTAFNVIGPKVLGKATTEIFNGLVDKINGGSGINFTKIGQILLILLALYGFSALCNYVQGYVMAGISQKTAFQLKFTSCQ